MEQLSITVIIPTHNRRDSLEELLVTLGRQKYPMHLVDVVVVADGCVDTTISMLKSFKASYNLQFAEQPGSGPAIARNKGASMARGKVLLFLDDDIIPSDGLLAAHAKAHLNENTVVIGYLPIMMSKNPNFLAIQTRSWWENLYYKMQDRGYRFSYKDLLSGNFSLHSTLFHTVNGFDSTFRCREDYELGARLIKHGAIFIFSRDAWGYHNDMSNNLKRLFRRKQLEGKADVQFASAHPDVIQQLSFFSLSRLSRFKRSLLLMSLFNVKFIIRIYFILLEKLLMIFESLKLRSAFRRTIYKLNKYWYFVGVANEVRTAKNLNKLLSSAPLHSNKTEKILEVDIRIGLSEAEQQIDKHHPSVVHLFYGPYLFGKIAHRPDAERLRGRHLRTILLSDYNISLLKMAALDMFHVEQQPNKPGIKNAGIKQDKVF
jgi:glycosyltransferase involved in cell wall biosynthesis